MNRKNPKTKDGPGKEVPKKTTKDNGSSSSSGRGNGGWQKIEALRERAALKASLADVWDEDFDLSEDILDELDHKAEFFTTEVEEVDDDIPDDGDDEIDDYYDDDEV